MSEAPVSSAPAAGTPLQLRYEDPIALMPVLKVLLITALLLALVYVVLRWYARRGGMATAMPRSELQCAAALRLSPRTRVYLLKTATAELLVTETPTGATVTRLSGAAHAADEQADAP